MNTESDPNVGHNEAFEHAEEALEFEAVQALIASKCVNPQAADVIRRLGPSTDRAWIDDRVVEIEETRSYHVIEGALPIVECSSESWIERAARRGELVPVETIREIAFVERTLLEFKRGFTKKSEDYPRLERIVTGIIPHEDLIRMVEKSIDPDGTIRDDASPRMRTLRKNVRASREELRARSERLAEQWDTREAPTFVDGRYMLLVPRDKTRRREGVVHAKSHSGGSLYFEPLTLVEKNNALETVLLDERAEEARIVRELTDAIADRAGELLGNVERLIELDALNAKARFAAEFDCVSPEPAPEGSLRLVAARHPLLEVSLREVSRHVVPLDLELRDYERVLVITGPNAGGKTVALKTLGVTVLMYQSGLQVPAGRGTALPVFSRLFADIGDEQSIAMSLSTFTSHLRHLDGMCRSASTDTLCLVDEIGDGTDPDEGAALAIATLERLLSRKASVVVTTHYGKIKNFALKTGGVANASMAFDDDGDRPLYRVIQGLAGRSRGIETARRLGIERDVIERALDVVGKDVYRMEQLLGELEANLRAVEREKEALEAQSEALGRLVESYGEKEREIEEFKEAHKERARREAEELLVQTRKEIESIVKSIRESRAERAPVRDGHKRIRSMLDKARPPEKPRKVTGLAAGDIVSVSPSGDPSGTVLDVAKGEATVEIKGKKLRIKVGNLYKIDRRDALAKPAADIHLDVEPLHTTTVDVRGLDRAWALETVDRFLDRAVLSGIQEVKIIHGVGEGILLQAIKRHVDGDPRVASVRAGGVGEGGVGVSFVQLK